jgi:hypothetical protein
MNDTCALYISSKSVLLTIHFSLDVNRQSSTFTPLPSSHNLQLHRPTKMLLSLLLPVLPLILPLTSAQPSAYAGLNHLRFGCSQITIERLDPLINPGMIPTPHIHQVVGGNAFNASMPSSDISKLATCTTCGPADDLSNYWTANLYFKARNGTFRRVPQVPNR